ncbi:hypothetical protein GCM10023078_24480 [Gibbsiella greigii]
MPGSGNGRVPSHRPSPTGRGSMNKGSGNPLSLWERVRVRESEELAPHLISNGFHQGNLRPLLLFGQHVTLFR